MLRFVVVPAAAVTAAAFVFTGNTAVVGALSVAAAAAVAAVPLASYVEFGFPT